MARCLSRQIQNKVLTRSKKMDLLLHAKMKRSFLTTKKYSRWQTNKRDSEERRPHTNLAFASKKRPRKHIKQLIFKGLSIEKAWLKTSIQNGRGRLPTIRTNNLEQCSFLKHRGKPDNKRCVIDKVISGAHCYSKTNDRLCKTLRL